MRVALVIDSLRMGGAERVAVTLGNFWATHGHEVSLYTLRDPATDQFAPSKAVRRVDLTSGSSTSLFHNSEPLRLFFDLRSLWRLRRCVSNEQPDVVISFLTKMNVATGLSLVGTGASVIGTEHSHPPLTALSLPWRLLRRVVLPRLRAVTVLTEESATWFREHLGMTRVHVIPNPISFPLDREEPVLQPPKSEHRILLAVGRLVIEKGFDRLLTAYATAWENHPEWKLVILGDGPLRPELEAQIKGHGLEQGVLMPGVVGNVGEWYEAADLFVLSSRSEGFSCALVEALSHGCPAVAVDCPTGPRHILRNGIDGFLIARDDHDALVGALIQMMSNSDLRETFAGRASEARQRFAVGRIASLHEEIWAKMARW